MGIRVANSRMRLKITEKYIKYGNMAFHFITQLIINVRPQYPQSSCLCCLSREAGSFREVWNDKTNKILVIIRDVMTYMQHNASWRHWIIQVMATYNNQHWRDFSKTCVMYMKGTLCVKHIKKAATVWDSNWSSQCVLIISWHAWSLKRLLQSQSRAQQLR